MYTLKQLFFEVLKKRHRAQRKSSLKLVRGCLGRIRHAYAAIRRRAPRKKLPKIHKGANAKEFLIHRFKFAANEVIEKLTKRLEHFSPKSRKFKSLKRKIKRVEKDIKTADEFTKGKKKRRKKAEKTKVSKPTAKAFLRDVELLHTGARVLEKRSKRKKTPPHKRRFKRKRGPYPHMVRFIKPKKPNDPKPT